MNEGLSLDYEYRGLLASTWDVWRDDTANWADRTLFLQVIRRYGQPVLDVGCSTGRLVLDFLAQGVDCDGVDLSPEMLDIARTKAERAGLKPNLYRQSMDALVLPRRYRTILVPSSTFQLLTDEASARDAMRRFRSHLEPAGALIMSFFLPWEAGSPLESEWAPVFEKTRAADSATVRRWGSECYEPELQLWHSRDRFEVLRDGQVIYAEDHARSPAGRWYSQAQAIDLYREAGLVNVRATSEFSDEPAIESDTLFCVLGEAPADRPA